MRKSQPFGIACLAVCMLGCGGSSLGPTTSSVNGTIDGGSVTVTSSAFGVAGWYPFMLIELTSGSPDLCTQYTGDYHVPNTQVVDIDLFAWDAASKSSTPLSSPGTYSVVSGTAMPSGNYAAFQYQLSNANCAAASFEQGTSGTVQLDTSSATTMSGTFDVRLTSGDHVTGTFNAAHCPAISTVTTLNCK